MPVIDNLLLNFPGLARVLSTTAALLNSVYLPAATTGSVAVALVIAAIAGVSTLVWRARRFTNYSILETRFAERITDFSARLQRTELQLEEAARETTQLLQRVEQLSARQESQPAVNSRSSLRQAIELSRHGATTSLLIETCGLSQGEAHLIQTLYGRAAAAGQSEELH